jgi:hypothetical protein
MSCKFRNLILVLALPLGLYSRAFPPSTAKTTVVRGEAQLYSGARDSAAITMPFFDSTRNIYSETAGYGQCSTPASVSSPSGAMYSNSCVPAGLCAHADGDTISFHLKCSAAFGWAAITRPPASFSFNLSAWPQSTPVISGPTQAAITCGTKMCSQEQFR